MDELMDGLAGQFKWLEVSSRERPFLTQRCNNEWWRGKGDLAKPKGGIRNERKTGWVDNDGKRVNRRREWLNKSHNYTKKHTRERQREGGERELKRKPPKRPILHVSNKQLTVVAAPDWLSVFCCWFAPADSRTKAMGGQWSLYNSASSHALIGPACWSKERALMPPSQTV